MNKEIKKMKVIKLIDYLLILIINYLMETFKISAQNSTQISQLSLKSEFIQLLRIKVESLLK